MPRHDDLLSPAKELGVPTNSGVYKSSHDALNELATGDCELYRRIRKEERHRREHRLWIVAVIAALAALASAIASLVALHKRLVTAPLPEARAYGWPLNWTLVGHSTPSV
jgi:hypothetical protein